MAARKKMNSEVVTQCASLAEDASELAREIKEAVDKCQIGNVEHAKTRARTLLVAARDLTEAGLAMLAQDDLQKMRAS